MKDLLLYMAKSLVDNPDSVTVTEVEGETTVLELQQTTVDKLKAASADGKLTKAEIAELGKMLIDGSMEKMSDAAKNVLNSAGVDITAIIKGAGEALIASMKEKK